MEREPTERFVLSLCWNRVLTQFRHPISFTEANGLMNGKFPQTRKQQGNSAKEDYQLERPREMTAVHNLQLRTGRCCLLSHLHHPKISHTSDCLCGTEVPDPEHILQNCPTHAPERTRLWPSWADLKDKLLGSTEEL